jgi:multidrug transporter EmrE-like cation transporter
MREKFEKYLNKKFKKLADTEEVKELKDEIISDLMEKSEEVKKTTKDENETYEICINSLGDLMAVIKEYKKENNKLANKIDLPKYKLGEELVNSISHGIGGALSIVALILCIILILVQKEKVGLPEVGFGILLGVPNFFSCRFLLKALNDVAAVIAFPTFSVATVVVVTLSGLLIFKERLSKKQCISMGMILIALILLNI